MNYSEWVFQVPTLSIYSVIGVGKNGIDRFGINKMESRGNWKQQNGIDPMSAK